MISLVRRSPSDQRLRGMSTVNPLKLGMSTAKFHRRHSRSEVRRVLHGACSQYPVVRQPRRGRDVDGLLAQTLNETEADWRIFDQKSGTIILPLELHDFFLFERKAATHHLKNVSYLFAPRRTNQRSFRDPKPVPLRIGSLGMNKCRLTSLIRLSHLEITVSRIPARCGDAMSFLVASIPTASGGLPMARICQCISPSASIFGAPWMPRAKCLMC